MPQGILSLQYAHDTFLLLHKNLGMTTNLKRIIPCFQLMSGIRINYDKSEMVPMNLEDHEVESLVGIFHCPVRAFPINYLGISLHH